MNFKFDDIVCRVFVCDENVKELFDLQCVQRLCKSPITGNLASVMYKEDGPCSISRIALAGEELVQHRSGAWSSRPFNATFEKADDIYYDGDWFPFGY